MLEGPFVSHSIDAVSDLARDADHVPLVAVNICHDEWTL